MLVLIGRMIIDGVQRCEAIYLLMYLSCTGSRSFATISDILPFAPIQSDIYQILFSRCTVEIDRIRAFRSKFNAPYYIEVQPPHVGTSIHKKHIFIS